MKNRNFVNLSVNPCKMCMPMGAVLAFKGIENSMMILHGSQGCSTYIRRHMAGHYNEPVDIASSSLNEEGTVYGGESNLKKGLKNIIKLYNPEVIGVATTCLAETIGEDIKRITAEFVEEQESETVRIIPVSTPGYGGTQFEGYFSALKSIVTFLAKNTVPNNKINIIATHLSPGDIRNIKFILEAINIEYILLPDISDTLDAPYSEVYTKIPQGGTRLEDIEKMAGARATIEIGSTIPEQLSPGRYLETTYGVPLYRCPIPMGIANTDKFLKLLCEAAGREISKSLKVERGRLLDGMIDSHKHSAEGRVVIYGEPELVYAVASLCLENGIKPVLISTGSQNEIIRNLLKEMDQEEQNETIIIDDTDFETIEKYAIQLKANILIGNGDGKFITEKHGIPLVRIGFPIHDRVGGQRLVYTGYTGTLKLLDDIVNTLLERKYSQYRENMYSSYFEKLKNEPMKEVNEMEHAAKEKELDKMTKKHPCYSAEACGSARMHIPVAPACNISCNYCNRKYDCVNESRPGVTSEVLTPEQAAEKFKIVREKLPNLNVVGIAGPGDALANFEKTRKSVELIKEIDPEMIFCLSTNGLMLPVYADKVINLGINHVTITINAIDPEIGQKIYGQINYMGKVYQGREAAEILIRNQLEGLSYLASRGAVCKVNIVMVKGINDHHIEEVVKKVKEYGAYMTNIMPLIPAKDTVFENMPLTSNKELNDLRKKCGLELKQMYHCKQCRADAIGTLENDCSSDFRASACKGSCSQPAKDEGAKEEPVLRFAVASKSGMMVDQHFGHAKEFYIYDFKNSEISFIEKRTVEKYCDGADECESEQSRIDRIINTISDCNAVLVLRIGYSPSKVLNEKGISTIQTCGRLEEAINLAAKEICTASELLKTVV